jgi:ribosomal protein L11 methyltransferase
MAGHASGAAGEGGADRSVRVSVPETLAEEAGAVLMDVLGSFEEERPGYDSQEAQDEEERGVTLVFYPSADGPSTREELLPFLPVAFAAPGALHVETEEVPRGWVEGWREHFRPIVVGAVRIRPPWEPPLAPATTGADAAPAPQDATPPTPAAGHAKPPLVDVVINPGLGFGTGLHPTTRGTLLLLQQGIRDAAAGETGLATPATGSLPGRGRLVDVGTGSGILAIAAAKLGWAPVVALDDDPVALVSARENVAANGVQREVQVHEMDASNADETWFHDATVLANMTLEPVSLLVGRLAREAARPRRLVVSGILAGGQEEQLMLIAHESRFTAGRRLYEEEWVSLELLPDRSEG